MKIVAKTEYQDIYRVTDGALLVVNKFVNMFPNIYISIYSKGEKRKTYDKNTKNLYVLKQDYDDEYDHYPVKIVAGTVLYYNRPVIATDNQNEWTYQLKTTGDALSGDIFEFDALLSSLLYTVRTGKVR